MTDKRILQRTAVAVLVLIALSCTASFGQATRLSDTLAPCFDEQTFAVVRMDITRIDVDAVIDLAAEIVSQTGAAPEAADSLDAARAELGSNLKLPQLVSAGVTSIYVVLSTNDLPSVLIVVPLGARSDEAEIVDWIEEAFGHPDETMRKGNLILAGPEAVLARWKDAPGARRPDLDRVAAAAAPGAIQVLIAPDADTRRVAEALLTSLPEPRFSIPSGAIADGLQWATLTLTWPPQLSVDLHIEATDPASAMILGGTLKNMLDVVGNLPWTNGAIPGLNSLLEDLQPEIEGSAMTLTLDKQQCARVIGDLLVPPLLQMRMVSQQMNCAMRLKQVGVAMHMYAQDHDGKLPPNLQAVANAGYIPTEMIVCEGKPYIYRGVDVPDLSVPMMILGHDRASAHRGGRNLLYVDGHVEWTNEANFAEAIARDNQLRRERGLPEKPAE